MSENGVVPADIDVPVYPELVAASLRDKEADLFMCWWVMKNLDKITTSGAGSGHWPVRSMLVIIEAVLGLSQDRCYDKLNAGIGKYWNPIKGKLRHRSTSLLSLDKVTVRLSPTMSRTEPFSVPLEHLLPSDGGTWKELESLLVAIVAARFGFPHPVSLKTIMQHTGMSRATVSRHLAAERKRRLCVGHNGIAVAVCESRGEAQQKCQQLVKSSDKTKNPWYIVKGEEAYYIIQQIANSYALTPYDRLSTRRRPRALRALDEENSYSLQDRRYYDQEHRGQKSLAPPENSSVLLPKDIGKTTRLCTTRVWIPASNGAQNGMA